MGFSPTGQHPRCTTLRRTETENLTTPGWHNQQEYNMSAAGLNVFYALLAGLGVVGTTLFAPIFF